MKRFLMALAAIVLAIPSFAQYSSGGFDLQKDNLFYGFRIGMNNAWLSGETTNLKDLGGSRLGLNLGVVIGLRLSNTSPVFLESGLYYTEKGGKGNFLTAASELKSFTEVKSKTNCLEIPVIIKYGFQVGNDIALLPFFGPYFSYAMGGKTEDKSGSKHSSFNDGYFKHGDMGLKLGCGAEYNKIYLEAGFEFGLTDIAESGDGAHNNGLFINMGVNF